MIIEFNKYYPEHFQVWAKSTTGKMSDKIDKCIRKSTRWDVWEHLGNMVWENVRGFVSEFVITSCREILK